MQHIRGLYLHILFVPLFLFSSCLQANDLFYDNPEFDLAKGDYDEIIHYDPLIFVENKIEDKSAKKLQKIVQDIKKFQNESKKITIFIEGHTAPSNLSKEEKIAKSREYALNVENYLLENNVTNAKIILSARGDENPYFTDILEDIKKLSNRVMLSLYMVVPDDADGDGIYSDKDKCPFTKLGVYVGEDGCPVKNIIALVAGAKKNTAIIVSTKKAKVLVDTVDSIVAIESADKAPTPPVVVDKKDIEKFFGEIAVNDDDMQASKYLFYFEGVKVLDEPKNKLKEMLDLLRNSKTLPYVKIIGHTDKKGTDAYNKALGLKRARIIRNIIVNEQIPVLKIDVESYGEANPIIKTADDVPQKLNRRVEVFIH